ncbi:tetratricopeptide repeat protein [Kordia zhangzhouensis]|uniref:tetratricopeptide repeat protein n=1 Tax=Kordia zhangzhouensis TaxID=1620405 RepID=UPI0006296F5F|nr:tetratricopeptide repeat protein [Kordia zhangzhouensis]
MNISDFTYILQNPKHINASQTEAIDAIIKEFPYFQAARVIYLKGLKNQDSFKYNQHLKTTAAYTTDRSILFDFITSKNFEQHKTSNELKELHNQTKEIEVEVENVTVNQNLQIEDAIKTKIQEAEAILDPNLFQPKTSIPIAANPKVEEEADQAKDVKSKKKNKKKKEKKQKEKKIAHTVDEKLKSPEETLQLGKPLAFDKKEKHSFTEWLQLTSFQPINRSSKTDNETIPKKKKTKEQVKTNVSVDEKKKRFELIDKFIDTNPKIKPKPTLEKTINLANESSVDQSVLMTETLAKVYLEQKKYKKAITAYNILILKYPEKSGFFADQIRAIKKLQQNN